MTVVRRCGNRRRNKGRMRGGACSALVLSLSLTEAQSGSGSVGHQWGVHGRMMMMRRRRRRRRRRWWWRVVAVAAAVGGGRAGGECACALINGTAENAALPVPWHWHWHCLALTLWDGIMLRITHCTVI